MTTEMLRSEEPCAMARTLTPARASAPKKLAAIPGVPAIPSPTTARIVQSWVIVGGWICPYRVSDSNASSIARLATWTSDWSVAKQIECSELPWEIMTTETSASRRARKRRSEIPGTPIIAVPSRLIRAISPIEANPFTGDVGETLAWIRVPGADGLNAFRI